MWLKRKEKAQGRQPQQKAKQVRQEEKPREEAKQEVKPAKPKQEARKARTRPPDIKKITMEYFSRFNSDKPRRKSWIKEALERAKQEPVMVKNLSRGQIMALINQVDRYNMNTDFKIVYKCDVKKGIVLLAPKSLLLQHVGEKK